MFGTPKCTNHAFEVPLGTCHEIPYHLPKADGRVIVWNIAIYTCIPPPKT